MLCLLNITFLTGGIFGINLSGSNTSALTYSTNQDISFTFAPSLSITLSDTDLVIDTLAPGNTAESNTITVSIASNTPYGYALYADVGSNDTSSKYYNTSDLIRDDNINSTFTSIATNASLPTLTIDNTWGYSTSKNNGTTWSTYNGLPTATSTGGSTSTDNPAVLIDTKLPADSQSIALKVAARASATQASGAYSNIINFYAVGKPYTPSIDYFTYLQDFAALSQADRQILLDTTPTEQVYTLKDKRDNQDYTIAKLKDGKIWMTKNLNLAGGTEITSELSDVPEGYTLPTANGFQSGNKLPNSSRSGFDDNKRAYLYNTGNPTSDCANPGCYSYYSWVAATAGSGSSWGSICPAGWRLPWLVTVQSNDFSILVEKYNINPNFFTNAGPSTVPDFLLTGFYYNGNFQKGMVEGRYWSSMGEDANFSRGLIFSSTTTDPVKNSGKTGGYAIRCIAAGR